MPEPTPIAPQSPAHISRRSNLRPAAKLHRNQLPAFLNAAHCERRRQRFIFWNLGAAGAHSTAADSLGGAFIKFACGAPVPFTSRCRGVLIRDDGPVSLTSFRRTSRRPPSPARGRRSRIFQLTGADPRTANTDERELAGVDLGPRHLRSHHAGSLAEVRCRNGGLESVCPWRWTTRELLTKRRSQHDNR